MQVGQRAGVKLIDDLGDHASLVEGIVRLLHFDQGGARRAAAAGLTLESHERLVDRLQVGQDELGLDGGDVAGRVDLAVDVDDVIVVEDPNDLADRIGLANRGEELIAQAFALRGTANDAGDVDEGDRGRHHPFGVEDLGQDVQSRVGYGNDPNVGFNRREGVVGGEHVVVREGVENRRFADVR